MPQPITCSLRLYLLARINRFTGHTTRPYSVAEHSLLVAEIARRAGATPMVQLAALMHDAHEAYTGDVSSPVKWTLGAQWEAFESALAHLVRRHLSLQSVFASQGHLVKRFDLIALATERRDLTAFDPTRNAPWPILDGVEPAAWVDLDISNPPHWEHWRDTFITRHDDLMAEVRGWVATNLQQAAAEAMGHAQ